MFTRASKMHLYPSTRLLPDPDPLVRRTDPDQAPDPFIIKQKL